MGSRNDEARQAKAAATGESGTTVGESGTRERSVREPENTKPRGEVRRSDESQHGSRGQRQRAKAKAPDARVFATDAVSLEADAAQAPLGRTDDIDPQVAVTVNSIPPSANQSGSPQGSAARANAARASSIQPSSPPPSMPVIAGRYRLEECLAEGGMGIVYAGWHITLDQPVAVKIIRRELVDNSDAVQRFIEEARALAQLRGPHVAQVLDAGIEDGSPFIVMELLQGRDLRTLLEQYGRLAPSRAVQLVREACEAVAEAHAKGIVHRDIKPENLFLSDNAAGSTTLKVIDFGISARKGVDGAYSEQSLGPGSPEYMAPEQLLPGSLVDQRADIWSLGIVLFELLTGSVPFSGASEHEICSGVIAGTPPTLKSRQVEAPEAFEALLLRCLSKSAESRFPSALELAAALEQYESLLASPLQAGPGMDPAAVESQRAEPTWLVRYGNKRAAWGVVAGCVAGGLIYFSLQGGPQSESGEEHATAASQAEAASELGADPAESEFDGPRVLPVLSDDEAEPVVQQASATPAPARAAPRAGSRRGAPSTAADKRLDSALDSIGEEVSPLVQVRARSGEEDAEARYALAASKPGESQPSESESTESPKAGPEQPNAPNPDSLARDTAGEEPPSAPLPDAYK